MPVVSEKTETTVAPQEEAVQFDSGYLNLKEALQFLHISKQELEKLVRAKKLMAYKIGGAYLRFKRNELILLKHEMNRKNDETSYFRNGEVRQFIAFNGFYLTSVVFLSIVYVYLILA